MPQIKPYEDQIRMAGPVDFRNAKGEDFGEAQAQGIEKLGKGVEEGGNTLEKHQETLEVSDLNAKIAQAGVDWTDEFQNRVKSATPGDTSFVQGFQNDYNEYMNSLSDQVQTAGGRKFFDEARAKQSAHFGEAAIHAQTELVKEKVTQDNNVFVNSLSNQLIKDPGSYDYVMQAYKDRGDSLDNQRVRAELDKKFLPILERSRAYGDIRQNPSQTLQDLKDGLYDKLDVNTVEELTRHAQEEVNRVRIENDRTQKTIDDKKALEQQQTMNGFFDRIYGGKDKDGTGGFPSTDEIRDDPTLDYNQKAYLYSAVDRWNDRKLNHTDSTVYNNVREMIADGKITNSTQLGMYGGNGIAWEGKNSIKSLSSYMAGDNTPEAKAVSQLRKGVMSNIRIQVLGSGPDRDRMGPAILNQLYAFEDEQRSRFKAEGKNLALLYTDSPGNKDFIGNFVPNRSMTDKIQDLSASIGSKDQSARKQFVNVEAPAPGLTEQQRLYNKILPAWGGKPDEAFGPNGEAPKSQINGRVVDQVDKLMAQQRNYDQEKQRSAQLSVDMTKQKDQEDAAEKQRFTDEQNKLRTRLGVPLLQNDSATPVAPVKKPETYRLPNETIQQWQKRVKGQ